MEGHVREMLDASMRQYAEREQAWWRQDRRGRWVVLEPGPGRHLRDAPRHVRDLVDAMTEQRGRRFSSLSRARAFAREVDGEVRRWRRRMPGRGPWRHETNPWARAAKTAMYVSTLLGEKPIGRDQVSPTNPIPAA